VLAPDDAALVRGFIVNRMRGDPALFADGMALIAARTAWRDCGLVPHFPDAARLPAEDAADLHRLYAKPGARIRIVVPVLPCIANFDDLDPLAAEPDVDVVLVRPGEAFPAPCDLVLLPGSKATIADLAAFRTAGWHIDLAAHVRRGGRVLGLCGGYQMLGRRIADPSGIEGAPGATDGLGLLDVETILTGAKRLARVAGTAAMGGAAFTGYEMHVGETSGPDCARPLLHFADGRTDGAIRADGRVAGTYVHGLFEAAAQRRAWLGATAAPAGHDAAIDATLDALAAHVETHVRVDLLLSLAR
jgi:adenosylcobyric acid synthase